MSGAPTPGTRAAKEHDLRLYHEMLRIRRFEEKCAELYSAGKIRGFLHLYIGEEANAVGVIRTLAKDDAIVATYRLSANHYNGAVTLQLILEHWQDA